MTTVSQPPGRVRRVLRYADPRFWRDIAQGQRRSALEIERLTRETAELRRNFATLREDLEIRRWTARPQAFDRLPAIGPNGFRHSELTILGSGPGLLELSDTEKDYLRQSPTVAMNRYLAFWDLVGIWPTFVYLADTLGVGRKVFDRLTHAASQGPN